MSYVPRLAPKAGAICSQLEPWLAEEVLDELDRLAEKPETLVQRGVLPGLVHDFERTRELKRHYVCMVLDRDHVNQTLTVNDIGHVIRV